MHQHTRTQELFRYISRYKPPPLGSDPLPLTLQPFIPDYIPALGGIDEFIKVRCCWQPPHQAGTNHL
jgi:intraflagellar transport protein 46